MLRPVAEGIKIKCRNLIVARGSFPCVTVIRRKKYAMIDVKVERHKANYLVLSRETNAYEKTVVIICTYVYFKGELRRH